MNSTELRKILDEHKVWVTSLRESGSRADLCGADLCGADLCGADLPDHTFVIMGEPYYLQISNG